MNYLFLKQPDCSACKITLKIVCSSSILSFNFHFIFLQLSNISEMKWFRSEEKLNFGIRWVWVLMNSTSLPIKFVATPLNTIQ